MAPEKKKPKVVPADRDGYPDNESLYCDSTLQELARHLVCDPADRELLCHCIDALVWGGRFQFDPAHRPPGLTAVHLRALEAAGFIQAEVRVVARPNPKVC